MTLDQMIREVQAACPELGKPDGRPGPATWGAIHQRIVKPVAKQPATMVSSTVDERSEASISTLHPRVQPYARSLVTQAAAQGITIKVISGLRTYEEQDALYAKGRSKGGSKVTNARAGYSNHNFGIAFDIGVFEGSTYKGESPKYKAVAALGQALGLEWGGNWKSIQDEPHYQLRPRWAQGMSEPVMLAELRRRRAAGIDVYA